MWTPNDTPPDQLPSWHRLAVLAEQRAGQAIEEEPSAGEREGPAPRKKGPSAGERSRREAAGRGIAPRKEESRHFHTYSGRVGQVFVDYSKQQIDAEVIGALLDLGEQSQLAGAIEALFDGDHVNTSEDRPALHTALRAPDGEGPEPVANVVAAERRRFLGFAEDVRLGSWRGHTGKTIRDVVHIGIGGSHLGPALACQALAPDSDPNIRFLANIDGDAVARTLAGLDPATTLFIVVSKSFSTLETRVNAASARSWFIERTVDPAAVPRHFVAVTANDAAAEAFGLPPANRFPIWDWVGGRYSLWSAVGLPIAVALGRSGFDDLLAGAHLADRHFRTTPLARNLPVLLALLQVWNSNFLGASSHALLAYDRRLRLLPDYLQQLDMESNGKSIRHDGSRVAMHTAPVVWGGEETNGQHAFHQLLHQGTRAFSTDLVATIRPGHDLQEHHRWLLANCFAQGQALLAGHTAGKAQGTHVRGRHPVTTVLLDALTPRALGTLLALFEHRAFCTGVIWGINPFDQPGVELGKALAGPILDELGDSQPTESAVDFPTAGLLAHTKQIASDA